MKKSEDKPPQRFLVISTTAVGDTLMGTPGLRALRESFPDSEIHVLVHSKRKELFRQNPHVDRVLGYRNNSFSRALLFLKSLVGPYDTVLVFHANEDIWKLLRILRYGVCYNRQAHQDEPRRIYALDSLPKHTVEKRLALVRRAGGKDSSDTRYEYSVPPGHARWAAEQLARAGLLGDSRVVGLQLGAADAFKTWPLESFVEVARTLRSRGFHIYVNTSPAERPLTDRFLELFGRDGVLLNPGGTLSHSAALIQRCVLYITPDTGPMHLAVALGVPVISLFCPTEMEDTGPLGYAKGLVIRKPRTCDPCLKRDCQDNFCMRQITADEVCRAAERILNGDFPVGGVQG